jgi:hypothetical protein
MNKVTYELELTPANAMKIDVINRIILGDDYTVEFSTEAKTEVETQPTMTDKQKMPAKKVVEEKPAEETSIGPSPAELKGPTFAELKVAAKAAKVAHGNDFAMETLESLGVTMANTLGKSISAVDQSMFSDVIAAFEAGPQETPTTEEPEEDDGFDEEEEEDTSEVTAEAVKTALKAYAKSVSRDEAKAIMQEHGAAALSKVDDCTPAQLKAMFSKLL